MKRIFSSVLWRYTSDLLRTIILPLSALFMSFHLAACEEIPSEVIDKDYSRIRLLGITAPADLYFNSTDSTFITSIKISGSTDVKSVSADLSDPSGSAVSKIELKDDGNEQNGDSVTGDEIYSGIFRLSRRDLSGRYQIEFYVTDNYDQKLKIGLHSFQYYNLQENYPPSLSGLVAPDTVTIASAAEKIILAIKANDPNGLQDISRVYFQSFRPDGTTSGTLFDMYDDGGSVAVPNSGDLIAGDGVFTLTIELSPSTLRGSWRFEFSAADRQGLTGNKIIHFINIR